MPLKAAPKPFDVDGVQCTVDKGGLINVGLNAGWNRADRFPTKVKPGADLETMKAKVREHMKFATLAARANTDLSAPEPVCVEPSGTTGSQPLQRELQSLGLGLQPMQPPQPPEQKPASSQPAASQLGSSYQPASSHEPASSRQQGNV